jgi:hypothetical protein
MDKLGKEGTITQWESSISGRFLAWITLARLLRTHKNSQSPLRAGSFEVEVLLLESVLVEGMMGPLGIAILWWMWWIRSCE